MSEHRRIRVCFTVDAAYAGGAETYVHLLASGVDRDAFDPTVLAGSEPGLDDWCRRVAASGVEVVRLPMRMPFRPHHAVAVLAALTRAAPHIVHVNMPGPYDGQMGLLAPLSRAAGCGAVVVTEHLPRVERLWKRAAIKSVSYHWVDRVLTVCRSNLPYLVEHQRVPEDKACVVYNGIPAAYGTRSGEWRDAARSDLGLDPSLVGIVFIGSLTERKGLGPLINAVKGLDHRRWRLFVVGSGAERSRYERLAAQSGLENDVRFLGNLPNDGIERILAAMDLLALPSFMEGMPYAILEAMACSLPVVASRIDGIPEAVSDGESGVLVPAGDEHALTAALENLTSDAELRARMGVTGRQKFEKLFTLDRHIGRMESIYTELVYGGRSST